MTGKEVLVIDDDQSMRTMLRLVLQKNGFTVYDATDGRDGLRQLVRLHAPLVLCDVRMPDMDGLAFLDGLAGAQRLRDTPVVMMSAYGSIETAIACIKKGAFDYISKPFRPDEVLLVLSRAGEHRALKEENRDLKRRLSDQSDRAILYESARMAELMDLVNRVAPLTCSVLISGETGTGKELIAREIHARSSRASAPFLALNCGAIPATLVESELFGHAKGAFTGALSRRKGYFEEADGGTLFLDEIAELPLDLQPKLLRVLQEGEFTRVGETGAAKTDVRVLAASALPLAGLVKEGRFREDLYYRLNVMDLHLPALRERPEDIPLLANHFIARIARREGLLPPRLTEDALSLLRGYSWPGNVRELENFMEKVLIFCRGEEICAADLPRIGGGSRDTANGEGLSLKEAIGRLERDHIRRALLQTGGNRAQAARLLEISLRGLMYKLKEYEIE